MKLADFLPVGIGAGAVYAFVRFRERRELAASAASPKTGPMSTTATAAPGEIGWSDDWSSQSSIDEFSDAPVAGPYPSASDAGGVAGYIDPVGYAIRDETTAAPIYPASIGSADPGLITRIRSAGPILVPTRPTQPKTQPVYSGPAWPTRGATPPKPTILSKLVPIIGKGVAK